MKKIILLLCSVVLIVNSAFHPLFKKSVASPPDYYAAVKINQQQFDSLSNDFKSRFPNLTFGGVLSKDSITLLLDSMNVDSGIVNYIFGFDTEFKHITLAMRSTVHRGGGSARICFRNGKTPEAFCPDNCEIKDNPIDGTMKIPHSEYLALHNLYRIANPNLTFGGCIDKSALGELLLSLSETNDNLYFRFFYDKENRKFGIMFIGGKDNNGDFLYFRNGLNSNSYCPNMCSY